MPIVKVWNDNVHDHKEEFKGTSWFIPAKGFIEMDYEEAIDFKGQFSGIAPLKPDGNPDERHFKMIRVEQPPPNSVYKDDGLIVHATGKRASSPEELRAMLAEVKNLLVSDPDAEKAENADKDKIASLEAQVAKLTELVSGAFTIKKPPGRPKKEATA